MAVKHRKRDKLPFENAPVMVTVPLCEGLAGLREPRALAVILEALRAAANRFGLRILQFSILSNHIHLLVQALDNKALSRGMQGLLIRIARGLNKLWRRKGKVFAERFHSVMIERYGSLRRALRYVLQNARKHGIRLPPDQPDPYSSGPWFPGWEGRGGQPFDTSDPPISDVVCMPNCLSYQYRQIMIGLTELPGPFRGGVPLVL